MSDETPFDALVALLPYLPEQERPAVLVEALGAVRRIQDAELRTIMLRRLARHLARVPLDWRHEWPPILRVVAGSTRAHCLSSLRVLLPVIQVIGTDRALPDLFDAVCRVGQWWP